MPFHSSPLDAKIGSMLPVTKFTVKRYIYDRTYRGVRTGVIKLNDLFFPHVPSTSHMFYPNQSHNLLTCLSNNQTNTKTQPSGLPSLRC